MRLFFLLSALATLVLSSSDCSNKKKQAAANMKEGTYKGKLEVAGICKNYTISVLEGNIDSSLVEAEWTDETTQLKYTRAFRLGNPCDFPDTLKAGDSFYFRIDTSVKKECIVCMAYYPTPVKVISIKVTE